MDDNKQEESDRQASEGRRRSDRSHKAILSAALDLLHEGGYRSVTIEGIAARAGVGKQTIYRWWPSKAAVVLEALLEDSSVSITEPNTGSLRADLKIYLTAAYTSMQGRLGPMLRGLAAEALLDPEFKAEFLRAYEQPWRDIVASILRKAAARGELPADFDEEIVVDMLFGFKWLRLLFGHAPLDAQAAARVAALVETLARN
jgi:AcrR family transcriptional regulator